MVMLGSTEILLVFVSIIMFLLPVASIVFIVYIIVKVIDKNKHVKELESRVDQLVKEKAIDERINSLEKRIDDLQNK